ncbi:MAG: hypothetical protein DUD39_18415 [Coriobacteriaceae bacterium]|nr:MAG: hypothetical protein DUD39_18415 [Coriobacteriaceae bacterium]
MARINLTLDQDEVLGLLTDGGRGHLQAAAPGDAQRGAEGEVGRAAVRLVLRANAAAHRQPQRDEGKVPHDQGRHHRAEGVKAAQRPV